MDIDELHKSLDATLRVGELESVTTLLKHKIKALSRDLEVCRGLNAALEERLLSAGPIDFSASVPREGSAGSEKDDSRQRVTVLEAELELLQERLAQSSAGRASALLEVESCRRQRDAAQRLAEERAADVAHRGAELATLRVALKDKGQVRPIALPSLSHSPL